MACRRV